MTPSPRPVPPPRPSAHQIPLPEALLLDLDGTLVHSLPEITYALNGALAGAGKPLADEHDVQRWIGDGALRLCSRALGTEDEDAPGVAELHAALREHYFRDPGCLTVPYPGVPELLRDLAGRGVRLGCVTNKPQYATLPLLDRLELAPLFGVVVCPETVGAHKPDPAPINHALACLGATPQRALHVGDATADVLAARAAGVSVIALTDGYGAPQRLFEAGPDWQLARLTELAAVLQ